MVKWPRTDLMELLGISVPIIQAPMAGSSTPALAAAASNAGGLGSLGCARMTGDGLREEVMATRAGTNKAFNVNFFVDTAPVTDAEATARLVDLLQAYYDELDIGPVGAPQDIVPRFEDEQLPTLLELAPPVVSFHYGLPSDAAIRAVKETGAVTLSSATTVAEARRLEAAGIDAVIAQGFEAGGHRGVFDRDGQDSLIGTFSLVPQIADAVNVPVIAAGGIADGRGIAAAFALGASGVQMGTAFLSCPESGVNDLYRRRLLKGSDDATRVTRALSGRAARGFRNRFVAEMEAHAGEEIDFPLQYSLTIPLAQAAAKQGSDEFMAMWAGQSVALNRALPAAELIETLVEEAAEILRS